MGLRRAGAAGKHPAAARDGDRDGNVHAPAWGWQGKSLTWKLKQKQKKKRGGFFSLLNCLLQFCSLILRAGFAPPQQQELSDCFGNAGLAGFQSFYT